MRTISLAVKNIKTPATLKKICLLSMTLVFSFVTSASALSPEQKRVIQSGSDYFNVEETVLCSPRAASSTTLPAGSSIYMLGDSITNGARANLESEMAAAGFVVAEIEADGGRAITYDSSGGNPTALEAVATDTAVIAGADAIVIALGTNSGNEDLNVQIPVLIKQVRAANSSAAIYWVNLFYTSNSGPAARNEIIASQAAASGYTIIDTTGAAIELKEDGTHPTTTGNTTFASTVASGLKASQGSSMTSGVYDPISLRFPAFPDEAVIATAITNYIKGKYPSSPWLGLGNSIGTWLLSEAQQRDINPLLIIAIGKQENGFGTIGETNGHVKKYFNYFGIKGSSPIDIAGSSYAGFNSPTEGITYFMDKVKTNTQGPDRGQYEQVTNFYDYLGMHQSGTIAYPGEPLDPNDQSGPGGKPDGNRQDGWDNDMKVYTSWDIHKNDGPPTSPEYRGNVYNPGIYYTNSINLINELTGSSLSTTPSKGATSGNTGSTCGALGSSGGTVSTNGYAFPLAPQRKIAYGGLPCNQTTCHHDGTAAYDLSYNQVVGKEVYAIIGGTVQKINTQDAGWCQSIQLKGSDGYYYWYGHIIDVTVNEGDPVQAGQAMAKVAQWTEEHTCKGTSSGSHLHIDRGCTIDGVRQPGGTDACRDPEFVPFLQALYDTLPI